MFRKIERLRAAVLPVLPSTAKARYANENAMFSVCLLITNLPFCSTNPRRQIQPLVSSYR